MLISPRTYIHGQQQLQDKRTSAALAAALRGSPPLAPGSPNVLPLPCSGLFFAAGIEARALFEGGGAEPRVRPGPAKFSSLECFPQRFPMVPGRRRCGGCGCARLRQRRRACGEVWQRNAVTAPRGAWLLGGQRSSEQMTTNVVAGRGTQRHSGGGRNFWGRSLLAAE